MINEEGYKVVKDDTVSNVYMPKDFGANFAGKVACSLENTGNGFIALFPSNSCTRQDYYVCLDYEQAYTLILALSAFKNDLGFK